MKERICKGFSKKAMALLLAVSMVIVMSPPFAVAAEANDMDSGTPILLSGFAALAEGVLEQSVPIGTSSVELKLPDTLEATVHSAWENADTQPPAEPPVEAPEPGTPAPPAEESEPTPAPSQPQDGGTVETPSAPEETSEPQTPEEPAPPADEAESADGSETVTQVLSAYVESNIAEADEAATTSAAVTIEGVTWESDPAYDGEIEGEYIFTAVLPEGYVVEEGVSLPEITVTVGQAMLRERAADEPVKLDENNMDPANGLTYQIYMVNKEDKGGAEVKGYTKEKTTGDLVIPESVVLNDETEPRPVLAFTSNALKDCTAITSVEFSKSMRVANTNFPVAFSGCSNLTAFKVAEGSSNFSVKDGVLFNFEGETLHRYPTGKTGTYTIPEKTTYVSFNAFDACTPLTGITFPSGAITLGSSAFSGCTGLTELTLPNTVKTSGYAFSRCTGLKRITVAEPREEIVRYTFARCTGVTSYSLPDTLTKLGDYAFEQYPLASFDFTKITDVGAKAFSSSKLAGNVVLPEVTSLGTGAFSGCHSLESVSAPTLTKLNMETFRVSAKLKSVYLPEVTEIISSSLYGIFDNCNSLTSVSLPKLEGLVTNSFANAKGLKTASFPSLKTIGQEAFGGPTNQDIPLATLALPAKPPTVDNTGNGAFTKCTAADRTLLFVDATGVPLSDISTASAAYKAENDGDTTDNLWYGWKIPTAATTSVTVTYDANSPTSGSVPNPTTVGTSGTTLATNSGSLARDGYTFTGWNTLASGAGTHFDASQSVTLADFPTDTTLYAEWTLTAPTVAITGDTSAPSGTRVTLTANATHTLSSGITYTYKWYKGETASTAPGTASVGTGKTYTTPALTADASYFCVVTATATDGKPSSPAASAVHTIAVAIAPEQTPAVAIDYTNEKLTGFVSGGSYTVNNTAVSPAADGKLAIDAGWFNTTLSIVKKGATAAQDSQPQSLVIPARPATPTAHTITTGTTTLTVTAVAGEEYTVDNWSTKNTNGAFTGLSPGTEYTVKSRVPATATTFASAEQTETATTKVSITAPTGGTVGQGTVTADKTEAAVGDTVTYTVTFADGYTPTLTLSGSNGTLSAPTKSTNENKWTYNYTVTTGDKTVGAAVIFAVRTVASIAPSAAISLFADNANNATAVALKGYLDRTAKVTATYDNGTTAEASATYELKTGTWAAPGGSYTYTATEAGGKTCDITVTVKAVTGAITAIPAISKPVNASGYTTHAALGLPTTATVTYTGDGYTQKTDSLAVTWSAIPANFGKTEASESFTGTVTLPAWATGGGTTIATVSISRKTDISTGLAVAIDGWTYGETAKTPATTATGVTVDQSKLTYTYSGTANDGNALTDSATAPAKSGSYTVTAKYEDSTQVGSAVKSFTVAKAPLSITGGTVTTRGYVAGDKAATVMAVSFSGLKNSETPEITIDYTISLAAFADENVGTNKPVTATVTLTASAKAANYTLSSGTLNTTGTITKAADGTQNPDYAAAKAALDAVHIITNLTPTLGDVTLPTNWSFTGNTTARLTASADNSGKQNFAVKYTSQNPNYADVTLAAQAFPVSTVAVAMSKLEVVSIATIGGTENLSATVTVTGAALSGDLAVTGMEWRSSCPEIVSISGASMGGTTSVTAKGDKKGVSMVGVAYKGGDMLGYVLVKVIDIRDDSANTVGQIKDITDTLDKLVDKDHPTVGDKGAVNAVADEVTKLPEAAKDALTKEDVEALDDLKKAVNSGTLTIQVDETAQGNPPVPQSVAVTGTAIACGVDTGTVTYYITPVPPTATDATMELKLEMQVDGSKNQLKAPLFFSMELPMGVDVSKLTIKHVKDSGSENVTFTHSGQTVSFKLDSFSGLQFIVASGGGTPTPPPSGGDSGSSGDDGYDFWMQVKDKIEKADDGDVIKANAKDYDKMPESVMDALRKNDDVSLVITWNGKPITIPAGKAQKKEPGRIYWPLSLLAELYADIAEDTVLKPADGSNPETGGPGKYIPVTGGELITLEAHAPAVENAIPDATENTQTITPTQPKAITPPDAGFEADAFVGTPDAKAASTNTVKTFCLIDLISGGRTSFNCWWCWIALLSLIAVGTALVIKSRKKKTV